MRCRVTDRQTDPTTVCAPRVIIPSHVSSISEKDDDKCKSPYNWLVYIIYLQHGLKSHFLGLYRIGYRWHGFKVLNVTVEIILSIITL